jgi:hypothetical protein
LRALHCTDQDDDQTLSESINHQRSAAMTVVRQDWLQGRHIGHATFDRSPVCADFSDPDCWTHLSTIPELIDRAYESGIADIDLSAVTSARRSFTRACARFIHEQVDDHGDARFEGIRYWSRPGSVRYGECWALFDDRIAKDQVGSGQPISSNDPDLLEAARSLGLTVEYEHGKDLRPQ